MEYLSKEEAGLTREKKQVTIDRELEKIYDEHGTVTVDLLLEASRSKKHPLHDYFDWNNEVAGEKWRRTQATHMIMASKLVPILSEKGKDPPLPATAQATPVRRLVSAFRGDGFKMRNEALSDTDMRRAIIEKKKEVLRSWCDSVVDIEELHELRKVILRKL